MKTLLDYIRILLLSVGGMLVSCTVLIVMSEQSNGLIAGKQSWIYFSLIWFTLSVLFVLVTLKGRFRFAFSLPDVLVCASIAFLVITYPWKLNPAPDKLNIAVLLTALWFLLRVTLATYPFLFSFFLFIYIFTGGAEAIWGMAQFFLAIDGGYAVEKIVGSFYTEEAFSGYLAMILPLCLSTACYYRNCRKLQWWRASTLLYYTSTVNSILILVALFVCANRLAWMAAVVSGCWVVWMRLGLSRIVKEKWHLSHTAFTVLASVGILLLLAIGGSIGLVKNNAVEQKMPVWKASTAIASEKPVTGVGMGGFPNAFSRAGRHDKADGNSQQAIPAGAVSHKPLYVSNEYLQIVTEHGIIGLVLYLALLISAFYIGLKNKQWGAAGGLLSLSVFSLASYPLQIPSFLITLTFFLTICQVPYQAIVPPRLFYTYNPQPVRDDPEKKKSILVNALVIVFVLLFTGGTYALFLLGKNPSPGTGRNTFGYVFPPATEPGMYPRFGHYPEFYSEYAQQLSHDQCYPCSTELLEKTLRFCRHPALYEMLAVNLQATGNYREAEQYLLRSLQNHPERIRSYYLLAKLYGSPGYYHPEKMRRMATTVLLNNRGFHTVLNRQVEEEMRELLGNEPLAPGETSAPGYSSCNRR